MSEFRFDKLQVRAELGLPGSAKVAGAFFVAGSTMDHDGPERVIDLLNARSGFFPFQLTGGDVVLYNRQQVLYAALDPDVHEAEQEPGYVVAVKRRVRMLLSNGEYLSGIVPIYRPRGRDRLSDFAQDAERFRYLVTPQRTLLINTAHIVELTETAENVHRA